MTLYPIPGDPQSAGRLSSGATISHANEHGRTIGIWENVQHYGAMGDGATDDTAAINAAISAMVAGQTLYFPATSSYYKISNNINVTKSISIESNGAQIKQTGSPQKKGFVVTASDVSIRGIHLVGRQHAVYAANEVGIYIVAPSWAAAYTRITVTDCNIENWGEDAIWAMFVTRFDFSGNIITDCAYAGIMMESCQYGRACDNRIDMGNPVGTSGNAYGIAASRQFGAGGEFTSTPRSSDVVISNNVISNNPLWEGIDTHAGQRISIVGNAIYNCWQAVALAPSRNDASVYSYAPLDCIVQGNLCESSLTNGTAEAGIIAAGAGTGNGALTEGTTCIVSGNTVRGFGLDSQTHGGGIKMYYSTNATITGNIVERCSPSGIIMYHTNYGFVVAGNTVIDPWSDAQAQSAGVQLVSTYNRGLIAGNSIIKAGLAGKTHICDEGIRFNSADAPNSKVSVGVNYSEATTYMVSGTDSLQNASMSTYTVTNPATDRTLNVTADTTAQVAAVLGTLISDLKFRGFLI